MMPVRRLSLTDFKCNIVRGACEKTLKKALKADNSIGNFKATSWGKKLGAREARANMNDLERFKLMVAKKNRSKAVRAATKKTKK